MSTRETLQLILRPEFLSRTETWEASANQNEKKGIKIISSIFKYKGKKVFKTAPGANMKLGSVESELKKRQFVSTYGQEYSTITQGTRNPNIFDYKKLEDMPCSTILNQVAIMFIQNWLDLKDDQVYQDLVLQCLRSIHAVINSSSGLVSESHKNYLWNDPSKNYSVHRIDQQASYFLGVRSQSANKPWVRPSTNEQNDKNNIKAVMFTKEDLMKQKQNLIKGSGVIGKWVVAPANPHVSSYQDTFVTHFNKYQKTQAPDFQTSISVGRLCPNLPRPDSIR
jgi:hypothetical protein